jgi:hypothetical protein
MPRTNNGNELFKYLTTVTKFTLATGTPGDTTTSEAITVDMADTDVASETNFSANDYVFIDGSGGTELAQVATPTAGNLAWTWPLLIAQNSGATVKEATGVSVNHIAEGGITFGGSQSVTAIRAATSRSAIAFFAQSAEFTFSIPCLGHNNLNLLAAFGAPETEQGAGTSADPYAAAITSSNVNTEGMTCFRLTGTLEGGDTVVFDILDVTVEVNVSAVIGAPNPGGFTINGKCTGFAQHIYS